jgi:hypothetical protein
MTVVRLVRRGELAAEAGAVHRRIRVSELARYQSGAAVDAARPSPSSPPTSIRTHHRMK